jgi:RNA polymerase sigma factor (sigma-70 family)
MDARQWQTEQFEEHRTHLRAVAYRMLGSIAEADDAVQDAWLRLNRADTQAVENMRGWLTTVVSRIALDMLRARQARREDLVEGPLPEPIVSIDDGSNPEQEVLMADSVGLALLVVLETLSPAERLAFVLHDMFGVPFEEIAPIVERSPAATRQLASRARRRVRGASREPTERSLPAQRRVVEAFLAASRNGDFDALVAVLDPDVVFRVDRGQPFVPASLQVSGREDVANMVLARGVRFAPYGRVAIVNGAAGVVAVVNGRVMAVASFVISEGRIVELDVIADRAKLQNVHV